MSWEEVSDFHNDAGPPLEYVLLNDILPRDHATKFGVSAPLRPVDSSIDGLPDPYQNSIAPFGRGGPSVHHDKVGRTCPPSPLTNLSHQQPYTSPFRHSYSSSWPPTPARYHDVALTGRLGMSLLLTPEPDVVMLQKPVRSADPYGAHSPYTNPPCGMERPFYPYLETKYVTGHGLPNTTVFFAPLLSATNMAEVFTNAAIPVTEHNCECGRPDLDNMISCKGKDHTGNRKFHHACLSLPTSTEDEEFICEDCINRTRLIESQRSHEFVQMPSSTPMSTTFQVPTSAVTPNVTRANVQTVAAKGAWSACEDEMAIRIMKDIRRRRLCSRVDKYWAEISRQMNEKGKHRSAGAVKNQWNRRLRSISGVDERATQRPDLLKTGLLKTKREIRNELKITGVRKPNRVRSKRLEFLTNTEDGNIEDDV